MKIRSEPAGDPAVAIAKPANVTVSSAPGVSPGARILFVDDEPLMRRNVWHVFTRAGYSVALAEDGLAAWNLLLAEAFSLVITDSQMPRLSGEELVIKIRQRALPLPVIVAAARVEFFLRAENSYLQVAAVLSKPFPLLDLVRASALALKDRAFGPPKIRLDVK
jgi:CheY-like chemotaxis protein